MTLLFLCCYGILETLTKSKYNDSLPSASGFCLSLTFVNIVQKVLIVKLKIYVLVS